MKTFASSSTYICTKYRDVCLVIYIIDLTFVEGLWIAKGTQMPVLNEWSSVWANVCEYAKHYVGSGSEEWRN